MNEEEAVLDFFAQPKNLSLALAVADQADDLRRQANNNFWLALGTRIASTTAQWQVVPTEDRNDEACLVGLHLKPTQDQTLYLRPMFEQQYMGDTARIYYGLSWSASPTPDQTRLNAIVTLREALQATGFKHNENFLAWQWTGYYPRRKDFLLRFAHAQDELLNEANSLIQEFLVTQTTLLLAANTALRHAPRTAAISLDRLRNKIT